MPLPMPQLPPLMGTYQDYATQRAALIVSQPTRTVTIGQVDSYLFWRIPSVALIISLTPQNL